jgi:hypothetical protein
LHEFVREREKYHWREWDKLKQTDRKYTKLMEDATGIKEFQEKQRLEALRLYESEERRLQFETHSVESSTQELISSFIILRGFNENVMKWIRANTRGNMNWVQMFGLPLDRLIVSTVQTPIKNDEEFSV